jgi:hypothetical protein
MELARETWTDERLDDLVRHLDAGFARIDSRLDRERASRHAEMQELKAELNARFAAIDRRFDSIDRRFDSLQRTMLIFYGGIVLALVGVIAGLN